MSKLKVVLIDDEPQARKLLQALLKPFEKDLELVAACDDLPNGVKAIRKNVPDLVLLDIEMPGHSGLELLEFFDADEINFKIIFVTAYNQYAIQAFRLSAVDYLLKPIEKEDFNEAMNRFIKSSNAENKQYALLKENLEADIPKKIAVPVGQSIKFIELDDVVYLKADNTYTEIFTADEKMLVVSRTLKNFEDMLQSNSDFIRTHKSYLVNKNYVTEIVKSDGGYLLMKNNQHLPITSEKMQEYINDLWLVKRQGH